MIKINGLTKELLKLKARYLKSKRKIMRHHKVRQRKVSGIKEIYKNAACHNSREIQSGIRQLNLILEEAEKETNQKEITITMETYKLLAELTSNLLPISQNLVSNCEKLSLKAEEKQDLSKNLIKSNKTLRVKLRNIMKTVDKFYHDDEISKIVKEVNKEAEIN